MMLMNIAGCGPQLRCNRTLAHSAIHLPEQYQVHSCHCFNLECHRKSDLDGRMGQMQQTKQQLASEMHVHTLTQLLAALTEHF